MARLLVKFARFPSIRDPQDLDRCEGHWKSCDRVEAALRLGRAGCLATAHLGNWELSAFAARVGLRTREQRIGAPAG